MENGCREIINKPKYLKERKKKKTQRKMWSEIIKHERKQRNDH